MLSSPVHKGEVTRDKAHFLVEEVTLVIIPLSHQGQTLCSFCSEDWQCLGLVLPHPKDVAFSFFPPPFFVWFFVTLFFLFFSLLMFAPWVLTLHGGGCNRAQCKPFLCLCALLIGGQGKRGNLTERTQLGSVCILQTVWSICHGRGTSYGPAPRLCWAQQCPGPANSLQETK